MLQIDRRETESQGEYRLEIDSKKAAEMFYSISPGRIIISHTAVMKGFEGKGYGKQLVYRAVEDARRGGYKIVPLCPFANRVIQSDKSLQDIL